MWSVSLFVSQLLGTRFYAKSHHFLIYVWFLRLVICSNNIASEGLCALARAMRSNGSLHALYIWGNKLEEPACKVGIKQTLFFRRNVGIILVSWEAAHPPLPWANIKTYFSLRAKFWRRGGVGGHLPWNMSWSQYDSKGLFTWSGGPRSSGVGFFCFHALGDTKQKKLTPLDQGPPLHVNRV